MPPRRLTSACSGRANQLVFHHQRPMRATDAGRYAAQFLVGGHSQEIICWYSELN
jgi:hypothetical protein